MYARKSRGRRMLGIAALAGVAMLVGATAVYAGAATEVGDAGSLPATAQNPNFGPVTSIDTGTISGTLSLGTDEDMYRLCLFGGGTFSASTVPANGGSAAFDSELFLFNSTGRGVYANDDDPTSVPAFRSTLPSGHPLTPSASGIYYVAISQFNNGPVSSTGQIFPDVPFSAVHGPTGPGGANPITGWNDDTSTTGGGAYTIRVTGVDQRDTDGDGTADECDATPGSNPASIRGNGVTDTGVVFKFEVDWRTGMTRPVGFVSQNDVPNGITLISPSPIAFSSLTCFLGNASVRGTARLNDGPIVPYMMDVVDNDVTGDRYRMRVPSIGYDTGSRPVVFGFVETPLCS